MRHAKELIMGKKTFPRKLKFTIGCALAAIVIVGGLVGAKTLIASSKKDNTVYTVKKETYENVIEIAGTVAAAEQQTLQALSAGTVLGVYVQKGDKVKEGDIIIQLDDTEQEYNLAKLDYSMASSRVSGSQMELALQKKQRLSLLQKIEDRKVKATFNGIIADLDVSVGDSLEAKDSVGILVNVDYLIAEVEIAETDVSKLKTGQKVEFTFPAYDGTVEGSVVSWPAIGEVTSRGATVVKVKIRIDEYPEEILPNFSFTGKIRITDPVENLIVESYAVARENGQAYVQLASRGEKINVKVSSYGNGYVKIEEGLSGGEVLKAQSSPRNSGGSRNRPGGSSGGKNSSGGGPGGAPGGNSIPIGGPPM